MRIFIKIIILISSLIVILILIFLDYAHFLSWDNLRALAITLLIILNIISLSYTYRSRNKK
jgi:hypothetical protein